jgi:hypothetical protein
VIFNTVDISGRDAIEYNNVDGSFTIHVPGVYEFYFEMGGIFFSSTSPVPFAEISFAWLVNDVQEGIATAAFSAFPGAPPPVKEFTLTTSSAATASVRIDRRNKIFVKNLFKSQFGDFLISAPVGSLNNTSARATIKYVRAL